VSNDRQKVANQILGGGGMPAFKDQLTNEQIRELTKK
jgi:mono/diheme cytochrome c family protein